MLDLRIIADGQPLSPLELVLKIGKPAATQEIGEQIEALIATLDKLDGDLDVEPNGDELDGSGGAEDEFWPHWRDHHFQPGCPISDPGEEDDDPGGATDDEGEIEAGRLQPVYGVDQSTGPMNFGAALNAYLADERGRA